MDDDKVLKEIKDSAENIEIPKSLEPAEIQKMLEAGQKEAKTIPFRKSGSFRKYASWAAAAVVFFSAAYMAGPMLKKEAAEEAITTDALSDADTPESAEESIVSATTAVNAESAEETASESVSEPTPAPTVVHLETYDELADIIREYKETYGDSEFLYETDMMNQENEMAVWEESAVDTEAKMTDTYSMPPSYGAGASMGNGTSVGTEASMDIGGGEKGASVSMEMAQDTSESQNTERSMSTAYSKTNTQEKNVDEGDIVKTDGTYIYALGWDGIVRIVEAETMTLKGRIEEQNGSAMGESQVEEMYISGDTLQLVESAYEYVPFEGELEMMDQSSVRTFYSVPMRVTSVYTYDISDKEKPVRTGVYQQDGSYLTSRKNGEYLYLFTAYYPDVDREELRTENYVPRAGDGLIPCENIYYPGEDRDYTYQGHGYLVSGSVKESAPSEAQDRMAVLSGGETFYVSGKNIYAAEEVYGGWLWGTKTDLVRFGYEDGKFIRGSARQITGKINDNFSMDEYKGNLRMVTTSDVVTKDGKTEEFKRSNNLLVLNENLDVIGKIEGIAKNEEIKSARFMGETGYFVTYRNTDPLFSVDLSDPEEPKILGELKVNGFSSYLHFYGENRLLGIGWETDPDTGETLGLKCSMFDISDPKNVKETDKMILEDVENCEGLNNYRAILVDPEKNIFGFEYSVYDWNTRRNYYSYGVFSHTKEKGFQTLAHLSVPRNLAADYREAKSLRGLYIDKNFYLVSSLGMESYDMERDFEKADTLFW